MTTEIKKSIGSYLNFPATKQFLEDNIGEKRGEFVSNLLALSESDANLQKCDPKKLMMCAMNATALNLPLNKNLGYAYVIPYGGVPQFQIGYKGLLQLAIRTGAYETINSCEIREGEILRNKITGEIKFIRESPEKEIVGYLSYLKLTSGFQASVYMTVDEIEKHALRFSKAYAYDVSQKKRTSKWSDPLARPKMAMKTVLKSLLGTYGVMTTDMVKAMEKDVDMEPDGSGARNIPTEAETIPDQNDGEPEAKKIKI